MSFDPETVERVAYDYDESDRAGHLEGAENGDLYVRATDYDALLALYRAQLKLHEQVCEAQGI